MLKEPRHDKTNKVTVRPAKTQIFAVRMKKHWVLRYTLSAQRIFWPDWADAQADLSLRLAHNHFVGFVMWRLISAPGSLMAAPSKWCQYWRTTAQSFTFSQFSSSRTAQRPEPYLPTTRLSAFSSSAPGPMMAWSLTLLCWMRGPRRMWVILRTSTEIGNWRQTTPEGTSDSMNAAPNRTLILSIPSNSHAGLRDSAWYLTCKYGKLFLLSLIWNEYLI